MIKKFVIEIENVSYEMSYEQAEKLYGELSKIFEKKVEYVPVSPTYPWSNYPQYPYVTFKDNSGTPATYPTTIQCGSDYKVH